MVVNNVSFLQYCFKTNKGFWALFVRYFKQTNWNTERGRTVKNDKRLAEVKTLIQC